MLFKVTVVLHCISLTVLAYATRKPAVEAQFPFVVGISTVYTPRANGALIRSQWVISGILPEYYKRDIEVLVFVGSLHFENQRNDQNRQNFYVGNRSIFIHREADRKNIFIHNIAILKLRKEAKLSSYVQPIRMLGYKDWHQHRNVTVISYGKLDHSSTDYPETLHYGNSTTMLQKSACTSLRPGINMMQQFCLTSSKLLSFCDGDQGAPIVDYENYEEPTLVGWAVTTDCQSFLPAVGHRADEEGGFIGLITGTYPEYDY